MLHLIKLLFNKDVLIFLIQMQYKKWKKSYITQGGWRRPKNLMILLLCKKYDSINFEVLWGLYNIAKYRGWLPKKSLEGEHVYLTGAGSGIGRLMAIEFAKQGCFLSLSDINMQGLEETSKYKHNKYLYRETDCGCSRVWS